MLTAFTLQLVLQLEQHPLNQFALASGNVGGRVKLAAVFQRKLADGQGCKGRVAILDGLIDVFWHGQL